METLFFYFLAGIAVLSALVVVISKKPINGVLSLVLTMLSLSGLFVLLHAHFIAAIQILIYAGAILVLFLFILMLLGMEGYVSESKEYAHKLKIYIKITLTVTFFSEIALIFLSRGSFPGKSIPLEGTVEAIGRSLFYEHLFSFELISFLLLVGVIGVVSLTRKESIQK